MEHWNSVTLTIKWGCLSIYFTGSGSWIQRKQGKPEPRMTGGSEKHDLREMWENKAGTWQDDEARIMHPHETPG